ncbi:MAG TPA: ABC transporter ATP-binding protein [Anaerolineales bacterium]|nr:ABC transporter ATP-binding protein [Anaerolineales bacterium]
MSDETIDTAVENPENIIQTKNVTKEFNGTAAVQELSFYVPRGKIFGFIGPSGSGKTTTLRMLTGYYHPTSGEVRVLGRSPEHFTRAERENIGYLPQMFSLYPYLTVWENLNFAASIYGLSLARRKRLENILEFVELSGDRDKLASQLSGGMQRRLNLAATLLHNPDLIFLDEPTAGVDPVLRSKFWEHFRELQAQGRTMFVTTQYVSEAAYCDLVGVIDQGRLVIVDTPALLRYRAFGGDLVDLHTVAPLDYATLQAVRELPFVVSRVSQQSPTSVRLVVKEAKTDIPALVDWARERNMEIEAIEEYLPPFDDVFVKLVKEGVENG